MSLRKYKCYLIICLFTIINLHAQNQTIEGKIIDSYLIALPQVEIYSADNKIITISDMNGNFTIENAERIESLKFRFLGVKDEIIEMSKNCRYIQLIMFNDATHCFVSARKLKRIEIKEQKEKKKILPKLIDEAIAKKIFNADKMCNMQKI